MVMATMGSIIDALRKMYKVYVARPPVAASTSVGVLDCEVCGRKTNEFLVCCEGGHSACVDCTIRERSDSYSCNRCGALLLERPIMNSQLNRFARRNVVTFPALRAPSPLPPPPPPLPPSPGPSIANDSTRSTSSVEPIPSPASSVASPKRCASPSGESDISPPAKRQRSDSAMSGESCVTTSSHSSRHETPSQ